MQRLRKFLRLPVGEQLLLIKASLLLVVIRLGLRLLPFRTLRRLLTKATQAPPRLQQKADRFCADRVARAVAVASHHVPAVGNPAETCLTQALATQVLLTRRGHQTSLQIGVARGEENQFQAHAWLECGGKVVIGGSELERYTRIVALERETP